MLMRLIIATFILGLACMGFAGAAETSKADKAADKAGKPARSALPTAHDPHYDDAKAWPAESKKSYHAGETWPAGRQWTWAKPGTSAGEKDNPLEPKNWLENSTIRCTISC